MAAGSTRCSIVPCRQTYSLFPTLKVPQYLRLMFVSRYFVCSKSLLTATPRTNFPWTIWGCFHIMQYVWLMILKEKCLTSHLCKFKTFATVSTTSILSYGLQVISPRGPSSFCVASNFECTVFVSYLSHRRIIITRVGPGKDH